ncbi:hypothetical protein SDC9_166913 [bioreactor metagenome]|uniref:Uncharacterized protein n=1 Tax=bioreactor metagenome TaxID=1076179 RepID=A0A645G0S2_9ZZZZ
MNQIEITLYVLPGQRFEFYKSLFRPGAVDTGGQSDQVNRGEHPMGAAGQFAQDCTCMFQVFRLADYFAVDFHHGIGAEHQCIRIFACQRHGFAAGIFRHQ